MLHNLFTFKHLELKIKIITCIYTYIQIPHLSHNILEYMEFYLADPILTTCADMKKEIFEEDWTVFCKPLKSLYAVI